MQNKKISFIKSLWIRTFGKRIFVITKSAYPDIYSFKETRYLYKNVSYVYKVEKIMTPPPQHINCDCAVKPVNKFN